jgi:Zn-dependent peptidase ImmA (M78 family)
MTSFPINSAILKWARERQGLSLEDVASRFKKDVAEIEDWESGKRTPTYVQMEKLAYDLYKRPIALFFFPEIPKEESLEKSFRTLPETEISKISPYLRSIIRKGKSIQIGLNELIGKPSLDNIVSNFIFRPQDSVENMAEKLRIFLDIPFDTQKKWKDSDEALKNWRKILEDKGVFIFKEAFKDDNFSGFCLHDKSFPIIYLNNTLSKNRQIFTLFHELAHLLLGTSGIDPRSDNYINFLKGESKEIEILCNKFAGEFLVPKDEFQKIKIPTSISENFIRETAEKFHVSKEVILRKLLDIKYISKRDYDNWIQKWINDFEGFKKIEKKAKGGADYYNTQSMYISETYQKIIFQKYYQNSLSLSEVADYLGIKVKKVEGIENKFLKKQFA